MAFPGPPELGMCLEVKKQLSKKKIAPRPPLDLKWGYAKHKKADILGFLLFFVFLDLKLDFIANSIFCTVCC